MMNKDEKERMNKTRKETMQKLVDALNEVRRQADKFSYGGLSSLLSEIKSFAKKEKFWLGRKEAEDGFVLLTVEDYNPDLQSDTEENSDDEEYTSEELDEVTEN